MLALASASTAAAFVPSRGVEWEAKPWATSEISDAAGLKALSVKLNPAVGYWDPLEIGQSDKELIAWYRQAEIKHGRVAMAGFIGYTVQSLGVTFPGNLQQPLVPSAYLTNIPTVSFADISAAGGPADQWDALPTGAKVQILLFVGLLELYGESSIALENDGQLHPLRGGKPGYSPKFANLPLNLFDPFGLTKKMSPEKREKSLLAEINNGRLAMLGMIGVLSASKGLIVPGLDSLPIKPYAGEIMAPFTSVNSDLPFVEGMLALPKFLY